MSDPLRMFRFEWAGKVYDLRRPNLTTERAFKTFMENEDTKWAMRQKPISYEAYKDALAIAREAASANDYGWCHQGFFRALSDIENTVQFLWYWFAQCFAEGTDLYVPSVKAMREIYAAQKKDHAAGESPLDKVLWEAVNDPNPLPPE